MISKRFFIETWGCQMNDHDSEKMAGLLTDMGLELAPTLEAADVYLLNTCSVREKAQEKIFSRLGVLRPIKLKRPLVIGVLGCVAQQEGERIFRRAPYVDLVLGPQSLQKLPDLVQRALDGQGRQVSLGCDPENHLFPTSRIRRGEGLKAFVTITEGCNNFCTYCIVPYTRGRERSRAANDICDEIQSLVEKGFIEFELLGQNVNSYRSSVDFAGLLQLVSEIAGVKMIRYLSPHPRDFTRDVVDVISGSSKISTHLHLPAQAGNSWVLKRMGRGYDRQMYLDKVDMIRDGLGVDASITSDFIVGFPGETDEAFRETITLLETVGYDHVFAFVYSPRPGTGATKHGDPVPLEEKRQRLQALNDTQLRIQKERLLARVGQTRPVLIDQVLPEGKYPLRGRRRDNLVVHIDSEGEVRNLDRFFGKTVDVQITDAGVHTLRGRLQRD